MQTTSVEEETMILQTTHHVADRIRFKAGQLRVNQ